MLAPVSVLCYDWKNHDGNSGKKTVIISPINIIECQDGSTKKNQAKNKLLHLLILTFTILLVLFQNGFVFALVGLAAPILPHTYVLFVVRSTPLQISFYIFFKIFYFLFLLALAAKF